MKFVGTIRQNIILPNNNNKSYISLLADWYKMKNLLKPITHRKTWDSNEHLENQSYDSYSYQTVRPSKMGLQ